MRYQLVSLAELVQQSRRDDTGSVVFVSLAGLSASPFLTSLNFGLRVYPSQLAMPQSYVFSFLFFSGQSSGIGGIKVTYQNPLLQSTPLVATNSTP